MLRLKQRRCLVSWYWNELAEKTGFSSGMATLEPFKTDEQGRAMSVWMVLSVKSVKLFQNNNLGRIG